MNFKYLFSFILTCVVFCSCNPGYPPGGYSIPIYYFEDTTLVQNIWALRVDTSSSEEYDSVYHKSYQCIGNNYYVPIWGKFDTAGPLFPDGFQASYLHGYRYYDVCELAYEDKFISLGEGYYIIYPYPFLCNGVEYQKYNFVVLDAKWEDICTIDFDTVQPLDLTPKMRVRWTYEAELTKHIGKSTYRFRRANREEVTIDDVVNLFRVYIKLGRVEEII